MKKIIGIVVLFLIFLTRADAFMPPDMQHNYGKARIGIGLNYGNTLHTNNPMRTNNHVIINHTINSSSIMTPPPPPPAHYKYRYKDFAGPRQFPKRSYYIPSYCMPETGFYSNPYNPFCNQYRPYGSNMYLNF